MEGADESTELWPNVWSCYACIKTDEMFGRELRLLCFYLIPSFVRWHLSTSLLSLPK